MFWAVKRMTHRVLRKFGSAKTADTIGSSLSESLEIPGGVSLPSSDQCEVPLGANLRAGIAPEDPDSRQFWIWDSDELEEEQCL